MVDTSIERFRRVVQAAYAQLATRRQEVNDLNVFPVADGDTGDNMALTMQAVMKELDRLDGQPIPADRDELVHAVARAALMGARGNSGGILRQVVRGAAEEVGGRPRSGRAGEGGSQIRYWGPPDSRGPPTPRTSPSAIPPRARC